MFPARRFPLLAHACAVAALAGSGAPARAQSIPPAGALVANAPVDELASFGDRIYARGDFDRVGEYTGPAVAIAAGTGALDRSVAPFDGQVSDVEPDGRGGWFVGGSFTTAGRLPHANVAHVLADGRVDEAFQARTDGIVTALAYDGSRLYLAGGFTRVDGAGRGGIAAVDAGTGALLPFDARQTGTATEMVLAPASATRPARLFVGMGQVLALDPQTGDPVPGFSSDITADIRALAVDATHLYVGGDGIAALDPDTGARDPDFRADPRNLAGDPTFAGTVHTLVLDAGRLLAGGQFNALGGAAGPLVALDPSSGAADRRFRPQVTAATVTPADDGSAQPDAGVFDIARVGDALWIGGRFTSAGGQFVENLAALAPDTGLRTGPPLPYLGGQVNGLAAGAGGRLLLGGNMVIAGARLTGRVIALDGSTVQPDPRFVAGGAGSGAGPMIAGARHVVFAENQFEGYAHVRRRRYDPTSTTIPVVDAVTGAATPGFRRVRNVSGVAIRGDEVLLARRLSDRVRFPRNLIEVRDPATGRVKRQFVLPLPGYVTGLRVTASGTLYATGSFRRYRAGGRPAHLAVIRVNPLTGALDPTFDPHAHGPVYSSAIVRGRLYLSGLFDRVGTRRRPGLAAVAPATGAVDRGFAPSIRLRAGASTSLVGLPDLLLEYFSYTGGDHVLNPLTGRVVPKAAVAAPSVTAVAPRGNGSLIAARTVSAQVGGYDSIDLSYIAPLAP